MVNDMIKIRVRSYDPKQLEQSIEKIIEQVVQTGAEIRGPIPLPTRRESITILRSPHKHKDSREQFETRTHKRLLYILNANHQTIEMLTHFALPSVVDIEIKQ